MLGVLKKLEKHFNNSAVGRSRNSLNTTKTVELLKVLHSVPLYVSDAEVLCDASAKICQVCLMVREAPWAHLLSQIDAIEPLGPSCFASGVTTTLL